ncbi:hypothetical protein A6V29_02635 [Blastococcus sp. CCUG 61487]|nr:hypothetical protein A6V29_02635 [Blastococcus sp. CCUG 61487]
MALAKPHELLDTDDVYIGQWFARERDFVVISWAAPAADAFYGHGADADLLGDVQVTRAFTARGDDIVGYDDERRDSGEGETAFDRKVALVVPRPPQRAVRAQSNGGQPAVPAPRGASSFKPPQPRSAEPEPGGAVTRAIAKPSGPRPSDAAALRHKNALLRTLAQPRRAGLDQVLATLQPRQHDLVKWDAARPLVVQGHPGAGKTIVAVHRAAYLVHPDREGAAIRGQVLLLGPTDNYVQHTARAVHDLAPRGGVIVRSLDQVFRRLIPELDVRGGAGDGRPETYRDFDLGLVELVESATDMVRRRGALAGVQTRTEAARVIYQEMVGKALVAPSDWVPYLRSLPDWGTALRTQRLWPLLAYCALASGMHRFAPPGHVIVDEAQDVRPIEWRILRHLVREEAGWTLVGDMNQRRSDHSSMSWQQSLELLELPTDTHVEDYRSVFRSTSAIHRFASFLLPRHERDRMTVQEEGSKPVTWRVRPADVAAAAVTEGAKLARDHRGGTVAVIGVGVGPIRSAFAMQGWRARAAGSDEFSDGELTVRVLAADAARGLEFDGVVVVEPSDFPKNLGRHGLLYTSLTRANRSLAVVHSKALPDELRRAPADRLDQ